MHLASLRLDRDAVAPVSGMRERTARAGSLAVMPEPAVCFASQTGRSVT
jgi:hypothetical protein